MALMKADVKKKAHGNATKPKAKAVKNGSKKRR
jgi:hypothetical protein